MAGYQSPNSPLPAGGQTTPQSPFSPSNEVNGLARRPVPQYMQPQTGPQQVLHYIQPQPGPQQVPQYIHPPTGPQQVPQHIQPQSGHQPVMQYIQPQAGAQQVSQYVQPQSGPPKVSIDTTSRSSSISSSTKTANAPGSSTRSVQSFNLGKTSGWYHGSNYDVADLWKAAVNRDHDGVKKCMKAGLNVNHARWIRLDKILGTGARCVADAAAFKNDIRTMRLLMEYGVDLSGNSIAAFASGTPQKRDMLLTGDDRKLAEKDPWTTPLHIACRFGYIDMVRLILQEGRIDPNARDCQTRAGLHTTVGGTASLEVAKLLLASGATVDLGDHLDATPLAVAAFLGRVELVDLFLNHSASINAVDNRHETPLYNATLRKHYGIATTLAARGANMDVQNLDGMTAFFKAASMFRTDIMEFLTECGADTDARDDNGCTALARAVMAKNTTLVTYLLDLGVDIDAEDSDGWTPLFAAMIHNDEKQILSLLTYGSNIGKVDSQENTALHQAAILCATSFVRHVLASRPQNSINTSKMNLFGETPLAIAAKYGNSPVVKVLLKHGAKPHHVDPNGNRALDRAMYWGSYACVRPLVEAGAVIDTKALLALQQGKHDKPDGAGNHDIILNHLLSQYPGLGLPQPTTSSQLRDLFSRTATRKSLCARMLEKQGRPPLDPNPPKDKKDEKKDDKEDEEVVSPDPFEACIPKPPPWHIINNNTMNIKAGGNTAVEIGAVGASMALGITNTILSNVL